MSFTNLTAITGRNDVGKSTILEALDLVLGAGRFDASDICVRLPDPKLLRIEIEFVVDPSEKIVIDEQAITTWRDEYLLNIHGRLHVIWEFDGQKAKPTAVIKLRARQDNLNLLNQKNDSLKKHLKDPTNVDQRSNVALRKAIRTEMGSADFADREFELKNEDGKKTWETIKKLLPTFRLFRSDRQSTDQDSEVQDPMKEAIKEAVAECNVEATAVLEKVLEKAREWENEMLKKLQELDPDAAEGIEAHHDIPDLSKSFKMTLKDESGVPVNKRGSGIRRLILLSFFRVAAERAADLDQQPRVVYGIEEPETSQHPANQKKIIRALLDLAESGRQVILTTHVPALAAELPTSSIRFVKGVRGTCPEIIEGDEALELATAALGVLADPRHPKFLFYVEGDSDVEFFKGVSRAFVQRGEPYLDLSGPDVAFVPSGGSSLKHWVNQRYLEGLALPEMHVYDRDDLVSGTKVFKYQKQVEELQQQGIFAALTSMREMENYIPPHAVKAGIPDLANSNLAYGADDDVPEIVAKELYQIRTGLQWNLLAQDKRDEKCKKAKKDLVSPSVLSCITPELVDQQDVNGDVRRWLEVATKLAGVK